MEEPNPNLDLPVAVPFAAMLPPVPRTIKDVLGFTAQHADIAVDQGVETCLIIAIMTPEQICHSVAIKIITIHVIEVVISITTIITYLHKYI
jgi:hypothetical protein